MKRWIVFLLYVGAIGGMGFDLDMDSDVYSSMRSDEDEEYRDDKASSSNFVCSKELDEHVQRELLLRTFSAPRSKVSKIIIPLVLRRASIPSRATVVEASLGNNALTVGNSLLIAKPDNGVAPVRPEFLHWQLSEDANGVFFTPQESLVLESEAGIVRSFASDRGASRQFRVSRAFDRYNNNERYVPLNSPREFIVIRTEGENHPDVIARNPLLVNNLLFHPGKEDVLLCGLEHGQIFVWKLPPLENTTETEATLLHMYWGNGYPNSSLMANQTHIAAGSSNGAIVLWDTNSENKRRVLKGHAAQTPVNQVLFFPRNEQYLISTGDDATIRIWDTVNGACVRVIVDHRDSVNSAKFGHNGTLLVTGSADKTVRQWNLQVLEKATSWFLKEGVIPTRFAVRSPDLDSEGNYAVRQQKVNHLVVYIVLQQIAQAIKKKKKAILEPYELAYFSAVLPEWMQEVLKPYVAVRRAKKENNSGNTVFKKLQRALTHD